MLSSLWIILSWTGRISITWVHNFSSNNLQGMWSNGKILPSYKMTIEGRAPFLAGVRSLGGGDAGSSLAMSIFFFDFFWSSLTAVTTEVGGGVGGESDQGTWMDIFEACL